MNMHTRGLTLVEIVLGALTLSMVIAASLAAYLGQVALNEHARRLSFAVQDATRVMERLRQRNIASACAGLPTAIPDAGLSGDAWLADPGRGGGKNLPAAANELIAVTCQDADGGAALADYCGSSQVVEGPGGEWTVDRGAVARFDPIRITVAVCWRDRGRVIGECQWNGAAMEADDSPAGVDGDAAFGDGDGVVESPAMLISLITCRQTG